MRTYKEYLIPETIDHEELRYLVSIGSCVLVKLKTMHDPDPIVELFPGCSHGIIMNFILCPILILFYYKKCFAKIYFIL